MDIVDPVGIALIAERLEVEPETVVTWRKRGIFPSEALVLSRSPLWAWATVEEWARETGRLK